MFLAKVKVVGFESSFVKEAKLHLGVSFLAHLAHNSYCFRNWHLFSFCKSLSCLFCGLLWFLWASFLLVLQPLLLFYTFFFYLHMFSCTLVVQLSHMCVCPFVITCDITLNIFIYFKRGKRPSGEKEQTIGFPTLTSSNY